MAQFGIHNYSTNWETEREGNDPRELTRNWTRNDGAFVGRRPRISIVSSMALRGEWKVRVDYSPRNREGNCVSIMPRDIKGRIINMME